MALNKVGFNTSFQTLWQCQDENKNIYRQIFKISSKSFMCRLNPKLRKLINDSIFSSIEKGPMQHYNHHQEWC